MTNDLSANAFFDLVQYEHRHLFSDHGSVWEGLKELKSYLANYNWPTIPGWLPRNCPLDRVVVVHDGEFIDGDTCEILWSDDGGRPAVRRERRLLSGASVIMAGVVLAGDRFAFGNDVLIESGAMVTGPVVVGDGSEIRQGAYIRGNCLFGRRCVIGHVTEVKHTIFLDDAKAGHFAYLGDSILGNQVNLGAGTKMANLRFIGGAVKVRTPSGAIDTGLRKFGAILGDGVQTGCNSVTSPGTLLGKKSFLLPNVTSPSGFHPSHSVIR
ncbi:MAG: hypothetical protein KJ950_14205 [Proteobacteria bacterium]|nr:hypothetical protein [Pseudomonadota bacterium]MBU1685919.1 hypothetical protein [Pseudomonadota bacterium]